MWVEVKRISPQIWSSFQMSALISPGSIWPCVYFQTSRDGAHSEGVTLRQWCDSLPQIYQQGPTSLSPFFNEMSEVSMCFIKVKGSSIDFFSPPLLIPSGIWSFICSSPGCSRYKVDIMDPRTWVCDCVCVLLLRVIYDKQHCMHVCIHTVDFVLSASIRAELIS